MTRVYIAASSREMERVREAQRLAALWGWELTLDWLTPMIADIAIGRFDTDYTREEQCLIARADLDAIDRADLLWFLSPHQPTCGAWVELGYAYGLGTPVIISGCTTETMPSIFAALAHIVPEDRDVGDRQQQLAANLGRQTTESEV